MALDLYEGGLCPCGCGYPSEVAHDPENEDRFRMDLPIRCHARAAMVLAQKNRHDEDDPTAAALLWESPRLADLGQHPQSERDERE